MKTLRSLILFLLASTSSLAAPVAMAAQSGARFFPPKELMTVGVYYYPEHWPREQWDRDFAKMKEMACAVRLQPVGATGLSGLVEGSI